MLQITLLVALALQTALTPDPDPAYRPLQRAYDTLRAKEYDQAVAAFQQAIKLAPLRPSIHKDLGYTLLKIGENEAARDQFAEAMRLDPADQRLLEAASLMSVAFPAWAVAAALERDAVETEEACDALARRLHFVVRAGLDEMPDGTTSAFYVFAHGLYREVLYRRQAGARRARRHIRIAERLAQLFAGREADVAREIALHFEAAGDQDRAAKALEAATRPAQQAGVC